MTIFVPDDRFAEARAIRMHMDAILEYGAEFESDSEQVTIVGNSRVWSNETKRPNLKQGGTVNWVKEGF